MLKAASYQDLVASRIACRACSSLKNPSEVDDGRFDSHEIGGWTIWQGNLNARLMVVGQDWGDVKYLTKNGGRDRPGNPTNKALCTLLSSIGIHIPLPEHSRGRGELYFTNAILCLKTVGGLQGDVEDSWFSNCGQKFLRPQIELLGPKVVVCLGKRAYEAVLASFGLPCRSRTLREAVESPHLERSSGGAVIIPVYHCGARVQNAPPPRGRSLEQQRNDWVRVRRALERVS